MKHYHSASVIVRLLREHKYRLLAVLQNDVSGCVECCQDHATVMQHNADLKDQLTQIVAQFNRLQNELNRHRQHCGFTLPANTLPFTQTRIRTTTTTFSPTSTVTLSEMGQLQLLSFDEQ